ncbi:MAG: hypothetical protein IPH23_09425 [Gammaproteobacteria bacterium]|nr:hypothetical protein [Gammaproteobacteria bacterium]
MGDQVSGRVAEESRSHIEGIVARTQTRQTNGLKPLTASSGPQSARLAAGQFLTIRTVVFLLAGKLDFNKSTCRLTHEIQRPMNKLFGSSILILPRIPAQHRNPKNRRAEGSGKIFRYPARLTISRLWRTEPQNNRRVAGANA